MKVEQTRLAGVLLLRPQIFTDERGSFFESYNESKFRDAGLPTEFAQDNHSISKRNVLRGLHYQLKRPQGKLVRVAIGEVLDVVVDCRKSSPTFGQWLSVNLSDDNRFMLWIPPGFAHGFVVRTDRADFVYKVTRPYDPADERTILWRDTQLAIDWQLSEEPIVSCKDAAGLPFSSCEFADE